MDVNLAFCEPRPRRGNLDTITLTRGPKKDEVLKSTIRKRKREEKKGLQGQSTGTWTSLVLGSLHWDCLCPTPGGSDGKEFLPAMQETEFGALGQGDPLEKGMATHSSIPAWRIPWTEEPGGLQSMGSQRVGLTELTNTSSHLPRPPPNVTKSYFFHLKIWLQVPFLRSPKESKSALWTEAGEDEGAPHQWKMHPLYSTSRSNDVGEALASDPADVHCSPDLLCISCVALS